MALNGVPVGDQIADFLVSARPAHGYAMTDGDLRFIWEGIMSIVYADIKATAEVLPDTFHVHDPDDGDLPVLGEGKIT